MSSITLGYIVYLRALKWTSWTCMNLNACRYALVLDILGSNFKRWPTAARSRAKPNPGPGQPRFLDDSLMPTGPLFNVKHHLYYAAERSWLKLLHILVPWITSSGTRQSYYSFIVTLATSAISRKRLTCNRYLCPLCRLVYYMSILQITKQISLHNTAHAKLWSWDTWRRWRYACCQCAKYYPVPGRLVQFDRYT
jgi:hypothetical protein